MTGEWLRPTFSTSQATVLIQEFAGMTTLTKKKQQPDYSPPGLAMSCTLASRVGTAVMLMCVEAVPTQKDAGQRRGEETLTLIRMQGPRATEQNQSQNHLTAQVRRNLKRSSGPALHRKGNLGKIIQHFVIFKTSSEEDSTSFLGK